MSTGKIKFTHSINNSISGKVSYYLYTDSNNNYWNIVNYDKNKSLFIIRRDELVLTFDTLKVSDVAKYIESIKDKYNCLAMEHDDLTDESIKIKKKMLYEMIWSGFKSVSDFQKTIEDMSKTCLDFETRTEIISLLGQLIHKKELTNKKNKDKFANLFLKDNLVDEIDFIKVGYEKGALNKLLFYGKPGTGKTLFAEYLAHKMKLPLVSFSCIDILDFKYGESPKKLQEIMDKYRDKPFILFFDEAESLFRKRNMKNDVFETERILTTMLRFLDSEMNCLIIFSTNLKEQLDPAFLRRMDEEINFDFYDVNDYKKFIDLFSKKYKCKFSDEDRNKLEGWIDNNQEVMSPAILELIVKKCAINKYRTKKQWLFDDILNNFSKRIGG